MIRTFTKAAKIPQIKKLTLSILFLIICTFVIDSIHSAYNLKKTESFMNSLGAISAKTHMLYCVEKLEKYNVTLIEVVVDFDNRTIMAYNRYHKMFVHPKTNLPYFVADDFNNIILTNAYANEQGIPSIIKFIFNNQSSKYSIESVNAITGDRQWKHDVICKY